MSHATSGLRQIQRHDNLFQEHVQDAGFQQVNRELSCAT